MPGTAGAAPDVAGVRRVLTLLGAIGEEYREGFDDAGRLVRPIEHDEARLLLADAREQVARLTLSQSGELDASLAALGQAIDARVPATAFGERVAALRQRVVEATGVAGEVFPPAPPSATRGQAVFAEHCTACHGEHGAGDGATAAALERRPAAFTDPAFMRGETPVDFFHVVSVGKRIGGMPAWGDVLSLQERWDVVRHVWSLATPGTSVAEGQGVFLAHCAGCHGPAADGRGAHAGILLAPPPDLSALDRLAARSDRQLFDAVTGGTPGTAMPGFERSLTEQERWALVAFLRWLSLGGAGRGTAPAAGQTDGSAGTRHALAVTEARRLLTAAVEAHGQGAANASQLATDAYLQFEPLEKRLAAHDPDLVRRVEEGFLRLRAAFRQPGSAEVDAIARALHAELGGATAALEPRGGAWARFFQSATIILREGFEVVLVIAALLAYVRRSDNPAMRRPILLGTVLGVVASAGTAALLATVFRLRPGTTEVVEGAAMLLASLVLFWVSYWIISKAEAERWQRYIQGKVQHALAAGSGAALAAAAFLAVYREGFETVLFYQALIGSAPGGDAAIGFGFVTGSALLGVVYLLFMRFGFRIPIRPFFLATGALLYAMAVVFAGTGIHELQEAGVVGLTPVDWAPSLAALGLFPTVETLLAQAVLVVPVAAGLALVLVRRRRGIGSAEVRAELARLRALAEAMRAEMTGLRAVEAAASIGPRLDGLIARVQELEARVRAANGRG